MGTVVRILIIFSIFLLLDWYVYQSVKVLTRRLSRAGWFRRGYWLLHIVYYAVVIFASVLTATGVRLSSRWFFYLATVWVLLYIPKLVAALVLLLEDMVRGGRWLINGGKRLILRPESHENTTAPRYTRAEFMSLAGVALAGVPFASILYGIHQRYDFTVREAMVPIPDLPAEFHGFTITQLSDIHVGSFDQRRAVTEGVRIANGLGSDLMVFTGDLVNNVVDELDGYLDIFARLSAPMGVYSVLGNHDYGDYVRWWKDEEEKAAHFDRMLAAHRKLGWTLLRNENAVFARGEAQLALLGVENWSARRGFRSYGDLEQTVAGTDGIPVKILLSHDPTHWDAQVRGTRPDIALTLSGHTHGAQFGVEVPGFRWSPVQYVYEQWAGLYRQQNQYLYVNRGFGFIGFMGRVGIAPEITRLTLVRGEETEGPASA